MVVIAESVKRSTLRALANVLRMHSGYKDELYFPIVQFVEHKMPRVFPGFHLEIIPKSDFPPDTHGETSIKERVIRIREDIYHGAIRGMGRDRMTMAHEAGHYILLVAKGLKLYRRFDDGVEVEAFRDPEWQAKAFAGELLCPFHLITGMTAPQIALACGVSEKAAQYHFGLRNSTARRY
jgi:Zn-dependent peptidase ImmA (M78 family)